jgi:predicted AAA+ superfamily ATPase
MSCWFDRNAAAATIVAALRAQIAANDVQPVRIVTEWLDLAEELGQPPSSREVAARAEVSHASVNRALMAFRDAISEADEIPAMADRGTRRSRHSIDPRA